MGAGETISNGNRLNELARQAADNVYFKVFTQGAMALVVPTMIWSAGALWELNTKQASLAGRIDGIQITINSQMDNRYRANDAERDFRLRDQLIEFLKDRISHDEKRIEKLESSRGR